MTSLLEIMAPPSRSSISLGEIAISPQLLEAKREVEELRAAAGKANEEADSLRSQLANAQGRLRNVSQPQSYLVERLGDAEAALADAQRRCGAGPGRLAGRRWADHTHSIPQV